MNKLLKKFKEVLKAEGRSFKWFVKEYLGSEVSYIYANMQITGSATLQPTVEDAIMKYLKEVK